MSRSIKWIAAVAAIMLVVGYSCAWIYTLWMEIAAAFIGLPPHTMG